MRISQYATAPDSLTGAEIFIIDQGGVTYSLPLSAIAAFIQPVNGSISLVEGQDYVIVTGEGLGFTPSSVILTVQKVDSAHDNIFAVLTGDPTTDGFRADLSAAPDDDTYVLNYVYVV